MAMAASVTVGVGALEITTHLPSQGRSSLFFHRVVDDYITPWMRRWLDPEGTQPKDENRVWSVSHVFVVTIHGMESSSVPVVVDL